MSEPPQRISYKRYLTDAEEEIPPRTQRRWALKKRCVDNVISHCLKIKDCPGIGLVQPKMKSLSLIVTLDVKTQQKYLFVCFSVFYIKSHIHKILHKEHSLKKKITLIYLTLTE